MARDVDGLDTVLSDGFTRYLLVDVLHGTDVAASEQTVQAWSIEGDLSGDPKCRGELTIARNAIRGESWKPKGTRGILSPFKATVQLTEVVSAGQFERRVQLGLFDVVEVPTAQDSTATVGARWVEQWDVEGDDFPDDFPDDDTFPGELVYAYGELRGGIEQVVSTVVTVEFESLDARALSAPFRSPRKSLTSAWAEWRAVGILPVAETAPDATLPDTTWPAQPGSRTDAIQAAAAALGGVPVVDSAGQWALADDSSPTVTLRLGENGTIVDVDSAVTLNGFANVIVGDYEDVTGRPIRAVWVAPGALAPEVMRREIVRYRTSDSVRTHSAAKADVAQQGALATSQEVDWLVTCVYNPVLELGDRVVIEGSDVTGIAQRISMSSNPTMQVLVRGRRQL